MAVKLVEQWYQLMVWIIPKLAKFPRDQRFLLADKIQTLLCEVLEDLLFSSYSKPALAAARLKETNMKLEKLRYYFRLSKDLTYLPLKSHHYIATKLNEIGVQIGGWLKLKTEKSAITGGKQ
jgi:hypothetical protein